MKLQSRHATQDGSHATQYARRATQHCCELHEEASLTSETLGGCPTASASYGGAKETSGSAAAHLLAPASDRRKSRTALMPLWRAYLLLQARRSSSQSP